MPWAIPSQTMRGMRAVKLEWMIWSKDLKMKRVLRRRPRLMELEESSLTARRNLNQKRKERDNQQVTLKL